MIVPTSEVRDQARFSIHTQKASKKTVQVIAYDANKDEG